MSKTWLGKKRNQQKLLELSTMSNPTLFYFKGTWQAFEMKLVELVNNPTAQITDVHVVIIGDQVKDQNMCCCVLTGFLIPLLFFPIFFFFCDWWNRIVEPAYEIPLPVYQKLQILIQRPTIKTMNIEVRDSTFGQEKAKLLFDFLSVSEIKDFTFYNSAPDLNFREREFSDFNQNMKPIKMLPINSYLRWFNDIVN